MSNTKTNGGPAFPRQHDWGYGMTLRDYFAAKAMTASILMEIEHVREGGKYDSWEEMARRCYAYADAMLKAREQ